MKKRLFSILIVALLATLAFSLVACNGGGSTTLEKLESEYGVVVDGGSFEEGSSLISNEIVATTEEATEVLSGAAPGLRLSKRSPKGRSLLQTFFPKTPVRCK